MGLPIRPRILLVDNEDVRLLHIYSRLLSASGYEVYESYNGAEALALARASMPDLVLLNMLLSDTDSIKLCRRFKIDSCLNHPQMMVLSSSIDSPTSLTAALDAGADDFITLPVTNKELLARVKVQLRLRHALLSLEREIHSHQKTQAKFQQSERTLRVISEAIEDVLWMVTPDFDRIIYVSPAYEAIWGRPRSPLYDNPRCLFETVHPEDRHRVEKAFADRVKGSCHNYEFRIIRPDGSARWIHERSFLIYDERGNVSRIAGIARDITVEKQLQDEAGLRESEAMLRELAENLRQVLWLRTRDKIIYINPAYEEIWGVQRESIYGDPQSWLEHVHPDDCGRIQEAFLKELENGSFDQQFRIIRPDGSIRWLWAQTLPILQEGKLKRIVGIADDITAYKETVDRLAREHALLTAIIDKAGDGICSCHEIAETPYLYFNIWNDAMIRITGYTREEINRLGWFEALYPHPEDRAEAGRCMERARAGEDLVAESLKITRADGAGRFLEVTTQVIDGGGGTPQILAIMRDVTERKEADDALRASREELRQGREYYRILASRLIRAQEEERRRLARELHDDLTQRIAYLAIEAGMIEGQADALPPDFRQRLSDLREYAAELAQDVNDLSRLIHPAVLDEMGLVEAIRSECQKFQHAFETSVRFHCPASFPEPDKEEAICLYRLVQEALRNIGKHACADNVTVSMDCRENALFLSIIDDGIGFDHESARKKGGVGLASMAERVDLLHGTIMIETGSGSGTAIHVRIPLDAVG